LLIVLLSVGLRVYDWPFAFRSGAAVMTAWNGFLFWRAILNKGNWIVAACPEKVYLRLFAPYNRRQAGHEPEVIQLGSHEIKSIRRRVVEVYWNGPQPRLQEWLVIEPEPAVQDQVEQQFERLSPPDVGCDLSREWFTGWKTGVLFTEWKLYRPSLAAFIREVATRCQKLRIGVEDRSELDLMRFAKKPRAEQRKLLAQARQIGLEVNCELAIMFDSYRRRSREEARELISKIDADSD